MHYIMIIASALLSLHLVAPSPPDLRPIFEYLQSVAESERRAAEALEPSIKALQDRLDQRRAEPPDPNPCSEPARAAAEIKVQDYEGLITARQSAAIHYANSFEALAQSYMLARGIGKTGASDRQLLHRALRDAYRHWPDRALALDTAVEGAILGAEGTLDQGPAPNARFQEARDELTVLLSLFPNLQLPPPPPGPPQCPKTPPPVDPPPPPPPSPPPRFDLDLSLILGASALYPSERLELNHLSQGTRLSFAVPVLERPHLRLALGLAYTFRHHRFAGDRDLDLAISNTYFPIHLIDEHAITAGPRLHLPIIDDRLAFFLVADVGVAFYRPYYRREKLPAPLEADVTTATLDAATQLEGARFTGGVHTGLALARRVVHFNISLTGAVFNRDERRNLAKIIAEADSHMTLGLALAGAVGVDILQLIRVASARP